MNTRYVLIASIGGEMADGK
jgi:inositol phosphorylceramide mannosyltransferase catalytic subunit